MDTHYVFPPASAYALNRVLYNRELVYFYADHGLQPAEALELARREIEVRKDIYGYDALAHLSSRQPPPDLTREAVPVRPARTKVERERAVPLGDPSIGSPDLPIDIGHSAAPLRETAGRRTARRRRPSMLPRPRKVAPASTRWNRPARDP